MPLSAKMLAVVRKVDAAYSLYLAELKAKAIAERERKARAKHQAATKRAPRLQID